MATNLWPNASVESGVTEWGSHSGGVITQSSTKAWDQTYSLKVAIETGNYGGTYSDVIADIVEGSTQYTFSVYHNPDIIMDLWIDVVDQDANNISNGTLVTDAAANTWARSSRTFTTGAGDTGLRIRIRNKVDDETTNFYLDGFMLETGASASEWVDYAATVSFSATVAAVTTTGTAGDGAWDIGAYIYTGGATGAATLHITHDYSATVAASVTTGTPVLNVATTDEFSATIAAVVTTGTPHLLTGAQLSGIDPTITSATTARTTTSATTARTTASSTTARTITLSTTARTIHSK